MSFPVILNLIDIHNKYRKFFIEEEVIDQMVSLNATDANSEKK